ncbi:MAG: hypothetical protein M0R30_14445 [Methanoregula sp.]|nr:hypothetical protein [Methanoregula sp.]MCK9632826.1 hypothetical protein [Methanoregula sp.]
MIGLGAVAFVVVRRH